ncbi:MAG: hypothetical protein CK424_06015 [Legionella sp.]|nr:MAG: hypothetical protein CK424_06015 [Legionella sp.]
MSRLSESDFEALIEAYLNHVVKLHAQTLIQKKVPGLILETNFNSDSFKKVRRIYGTRLAVCQEFWTTRYASAHYTENTDHLFHMLGSRSLSVTLHEIDLRYVAQKINTDFGTNYPIPVRHAHSNLAVTFILEQDYFMGQLLELTKNKTNQLLLCMLFGCLVLSAVLLSTMWLVSAATMGVGFFSKMKYHCTRQSYDISQSPEQDRRDDEEFARILQTVD